MDGILRNFPNSSILRDGCVEPSGDRRSSFRVGVEKESKFWTPAVQTGGHNLFSDFSMCRMISFGMSVGRMVLCFRCQGDENKKVE